jgi:putative transposase
MLRGNGGQDIFIDNAGRARFCLLLQYACEKHQLNTHGFCLMGNHVHLIMQPLTANLTAGMHALAFRYAQYFNRKYGRKGFLYQGRYKAVLVMQSRPLSVLGVGLNTIQTNMSDHRPIGAKITY